MHPAVRRVREVLAEHGAPDRVEELPDPAPTAAAAAAQLGCPVGAIANSVVFRVDGAPLLVVTSGAHRVDTRLLARLRGVAHRRIRRADPEFVLEVTGQGVGGIAPIGHPGPLPTLIDEHLDDYPHIWAGAGLPHTVFRTTCADLVRLTGAATAVVSTD
ncbi:MULTISPECIES: YbaK/EbsC family protein [unclassified Streptomyces]|uniref:YbaK/EbsC family protein n=1 Tax=unclassified Streptomyces TaxID=2593676 RepID=UPI00381F043B